MKTHIAIVDDHRVVAEALAHSLSLFDDIIVERAYTDPQACLDDIAMGTKLDVLLSDFTMPTRNGIDLCIEAKRMHPTLKCILLSMHNSTELRYRCGRANIEGCIPKTSSIADIHRTIQAVADGHSLIEEDRAHDDGGVFHPESVILSPSEVEVIRCIVCREMTSRAAAEHLYRSHHTIEQHRKNIYTKLGIDSIAALTKYALEAGLCTAEKPNTSY